MSRHRGVPVPQMTKAAWTIDQTQSHQWQTHQRQEPTKHSAPEKVRTYWQSPQPNKGTCDRIKETYVEYCDNTTLHGLRYTTVTNTKHWIERFVWIVVCALAVAVTAVLCRRTWVRFQNSPTLTTVDNTNHPIWDIPFPAVTICNVNQVYRKKAESIQSSLAKYGEVNETDAHMFLRDLPNLIRPGRIRLNKEKLESIQVAIEENGFSTEDLMNYLAQPCSTAIVFCLWQDRPVPCQEIISPSRCQEGNCCSFSYPINSTGQRFPTGAGEGSGLVLFIQPEIDEYFSATRPFYATKILIHDPMEYPDSSAGALLQPGESLTLGVSVTTIESDASVRDLKIPQRGCLFEDERGPFFDEKEQLYNYRKCMTQCTLQSIMELCACAPFFYPDRPDGVRVCNLMDVPCMKKHRDKVTLASVNRKPGFAGEIELASYQCGCLPECSETFYNVGLIQAKRRKNAFYTAQFGNQTFSQRGDTDNILKTAVLKVHFEDISCLKYRREALMTWDSLFATFGGIVGLCLGGSVLSVVEVIYYATLRLWVSGAKEENAPPVQKSREPPHKVQPRDNPEHASWDAKKFKPAVTNDPRFDSFKRKALY